MVNLTLHITVPKGLRLINNQVLEKHVTFDVVSSVFPFFASVDQVKLLGGPLIQKLQDISLVGTIYNASKQAMLMNVCPPRRRSIPGSFPGGNHTVQEHRLYDGAMNQWVQAAAAKQLLLSVTEIFGQPGSHVLANFSVTRQKGFETEGTPAKLKELADLMKLYETSIRSGGRVAPGGHAKPRMAAKGVLDWEEKTPARTWITTGMGSNAQTIDTGGITGGRGKSWHFFASPQFMGPMSGYRFGIYQSNSPMSTVYPMFTTAPLPIPNM